MTRVSATYWRVCIDNHVLGCWHGLDRAKAAAEEAALAEDAATSRISTAR